jgi:NAD(P)-dependent dehydrogenase (short-subunit alcohol dehydrogenase family)
MSVAIVTGASRGIGAAVARAAARDGYAVCINYHRSEARAQELKAQIESDGGRAITVQGDVAIEDDVLRLFEESASALGQVTALVNNAGILEHHSPLADMSTERFRRVFDTNVIGSLMCAREAIKRMSTKSGGQGGAIVNISSMAARLGAPNEYVDYAASKGAIDSMTIGLSRETADCGIRVNAVRPGVIYTDIHASGGEPDRVDRVKSGVPMQRGGTVEEVADAVLWLMSPQSAYCTGTFIDVSGGR